MAASPVFLQTDWARELRGNRIHPQLKGRLLYQSNRPFGAKGRQFLIGFSADEVHHALMGCKTNLCYRYVLLALVPGVLLMKKYAISREFFPWNLFAPPISEKFLSMSVPLMKPPKFLWSDKDLDVASHEIESFDGEKITCFVLSPKTLSKKMSCLVYFHGGGFVLEAAGHHYRNAMRYAREVGCKVVFPLYRLAPKHPFPMFFEDCYAAFCWAYDHAGELGIDTQHIGIGGDSAGATLAVGVCMMAKERNHPVQFRFQMLPYPFLDARNESESSKRFTDTPMWNSSLSDRIGPMTKAEKHHPNYAWYSPVEAKNFKGLPPAYIETAEFDCLHDDGILYARLLREAGIGVTLNETLGTMHGFDIATKAPTTLAAMEQRIAFMKRLI